MTPRRTQSKRGAAKKRRPSPGNEAAQRAAAFAAIRRLYAEIVPSWLTCRRGYCRRHKACHAEVGACLERAWPLLPKEAQERAYREVLAGGSRRLPPATPLERRLRLFPPSNFVHKAWT